MPDRFKVTVFAHDGEASVELDKEKYRITVADLQRIGVVDGAEADCDTVLLLERAAEKLGCIKKAFVYLSYRALPVRMLWRKLIVAGFSEDAVSAAVELLKSRGYLDDESLCREYANALQRSKGYGAMRIKKELYSKGFDRECIELAVEELEDTPDEVIITTLRQRFPNLDPNDRQARTKAVRYLASKGYEYDDINNAISAFEKE